MKKKRNKKDIELISECFPDVQSFTTCLFGFIDSLDENNENELLLKYDLLKKVDFIIKHSDEKEKNKI